MPSLWYNRFPGVGFGFGFGFLALLWIFRSELRQVTQ
jgi:hypothetical protein